MEQEEPSLRPVVGIKSEVFSYGVINSEIISDGTIKPEIISDRVIKSENLQNPAELATVPEITINGIKNYLWTSTSEHIYLPDEKVNAVNTVKVEPGLIVKNVHSSSLFGACRSERSSYDGFSEAAPVQGFYQQSLQEKVEWMPKGRKGKRHSESPAPATTSPGGTDADTNETRHESSGKVAAMKSLTKSKAAEKRFAWNMRRQQFTRAYTRNNHIKTRHYAELPFGCSLCFERFTDEHNLSVHERLHRGEKPNSCDVCKKAFLERKALKSHMRTHSGEKPYSCSYCPERFLRKRDRISHERTHTGEKPFCCHVCHSTFRQRCSLKLHLIAHTDRRPFNCELCNKGFLTKYLLSVHMRIHTGEKPYHCDVCGMQFLYRCTLYSHEKTHGEKTCECQVCGMMFERKLALTKHMRTKQDKSELFG